MCIKNIYIYCKGKEVHAHHSSSRREFLPKGEIFKILFRGRTRLLLRGQKYFNT